MITNNSYFETFFKDSIGSLQLLIQHDPLKLSCGLLLKLYTAIEVDGRLSIFQDDNNFVRVHFKGGKNSRDISFINFLIRQITTNVNLIYKQEIDYIILKTDVTLEYICGNRDMDLMWFFEFELYEGWIQHFVYFVYLKCPQINDEKSTIYNSPNEFCYLHKMFGPPQKNGSLHHMLHTHLSNDIDELTNMMTFGIDIDDTQPGAI